MTWIEKLTGSMMDMKIKQTRAGIVQQAEEVKICICKAERLNYFMARPQGKARRLDAIFIGTTVTKQEP